jgi:hypothetical protein
LTLPGTWSPSPPVSQQGNTFSYVYSGGAQAAPVTITFSQAQPASITVAAGSAISYTISTLVNAGYSGTSISLNVTGLPAGANFGQGTVTPGSPFTLIVSTTSATPPGTYPLTIIAIDGAQSYFASATLVVSSVVPSLSGAYPNSATAGGPAFSLSVNGSGLLTGATVQWNGSALPTTFVSAAQLTALVSANLIAATGGPSITVVNPGGSTSNAMTFIISPPTPGTTITDLGVYRNGVWLVDWNGNNQWDATDAAHVFSFGLPGDIPVTGDWNGDGRLKAGIYRNGVWFVDWNGNNQWDDTDAAHVFSFGLPGDIPVRGDWNGDGQIKAGIYRNGVWFVDWNGNNQWDATDAAHVFFFGLPGDGPVTGGWNPAQSNAINTPLTVSEFQTTSAVDGRHPPFNVMEYLATWRNTLHVLDGNAEFRTATERMQREQKDIAETPDLQRQIFDMQRDVEEILGRPEVQNEVLRMRQEMEVTAPYRLAPQH